MRVLDAGLVIGRAGRSVRALPNESKARQGGRPTAAVYRYRTHGACSVFLKLHAFNPGIRRSTGPRSTQTWRRTKTETEHMKLYGLTHKEDDSPIVRQVTTCKVGIGLPQGKDIHVYIDAQNKW